MYNTQYCKVEYLEEKNAVFCQWKQFCRGDDYRNPFRYGEELIKKYKPTTWIWVRLWDKKRLWVSFLRWS